MKWLWLLLLAGCSTVNRAPVKPVQAPPFPKPLIAPAMDGMGGGSGGSVPRTNSFRLQYPPDATNYQRWDLEQSTDMTNWGILKSYGPLDPSKTNLWEDVHMGTNKILFWRMHGYR